MPIYEFECTSCGHRFEKMMRMTADPPACPQCAAAVRKLISQSAFILKGGGWYKDHYGLKGGDKPGAEAKGEAKGEAKTDAAPKADAAPKPDAPKSDAAPKPAAPPTPAAPKPASSTGAAAK